MVFKRTASFLLLVWFSLCLFSYLLSGLLSFPYLESVLLAGMMLYSLLVIVDLCFVKFRMRRNYFFAIIFFLLGVGGVAFTALLSQPNLFYVPSVVYELYKLFVPFSFFYFARICFVDDSKWVDFILLVFLGVNLIVLISQHVFGVGVVRYFGVVQDVSFYASRGRPTGLTQNANIIGVFSFFVFVYALISMKYRSICRLRYLCFVALFCVLLSSSKSALLCTILFYFSRKISFRSIVASLGAIVGGIWGVYAINLYNIQGKFEAYSVFFLALYGNAGIVESHTEGRLWGWYNAIRLFVNWPFGYGHGVWGDFSSRLNPGSSQIPFYVPSSDSAMSHLLVEQGVFICLYLLLIRYLVRGDYGNIIFASVVALMFTNYGFSQSLFYVGFGLVVVVQSYRNNWRGSER